MIQIRKEENQKKQKEKKLKVYKVNTHKKTVIALWVLLAVVTCPVWLGLLGGLIGLVMGVFGALDLPIAFLNWASPVVLLFAAALSVHEKSSLKWKPALGLGALSVVYIAGAATAMYITSTPVGMIRIIGMQARYFLPAFLMLFVLLAALLSHVLEPRLALGRTKARTVALGTAAAFGAVGAVLLFQHYFIGPVFTIR